MEYVGALVASSVVVVLVAVAIAVPTSRERIVSVVQTAVCSVTDDGICGADGTFTGGGTTADDASGAADENDTADQNVAGGENTAGSDAEEGDQAQNDEPEEESCHGFLGCAWSGAQQVGSGIYNVGKGAVDDVVGVVDLVTNPGQIVDAGEYIVNHPIDAARQLIWDDESADMWGRGDYGGAAGRTLWNVGSWFIPGVNIGRGVSKAGKFGKLGRAAEAAAELGAVGRLADDTADLARRAKEAAAAGRYAEAERLAGEASTKADEAEAAAKANGCRLGAAGVLGGGGSRLGLAAAPAMAVVAAPTMAAPTMATPAFAGPAFATPAFAGPAFAASGFASSTFAGSVLLAKECGTDDIGDAERARAEADAAEVAASSRIVPGGGLAAHEAAGGHTLERHVGISDEDLLARLAAEPNIRGSSSYTSRAVAERSLSKVIDDNSANITDWLAGSRPRFVINGPAGEVVGRSVTRGSNTAQDASNVRAVLVRDPSFPDGYRILTSFPTLP